MKINNLDKIYVLNHIDFVSRREQIEKRLSDENLEYELVQNFHPNDIDYEKELQDYEKFIDFDIVQPFHTYRNFSRKISIGSLSLVLKHLWCFNQQVQNNYENILILEDDANIPPNFADYLKHNMSEFVELKNTQGIEVLMMGTSHGFFSKGYKAGKYVHYSENQKTRCTHAYVTSISAAQKFIDNFRPINNPIDFKLNEIIQLKNIKVAWSEPGLIQKM